MSSGEKMAIAVLAGTIIITVAVALWILQRPQWVKDWIERHR